MGTSGDEPEESHRPALRKLTADIREMREELRDGFTDEPQESSRDQLLRWTQRLTVRTLGEMPQSFYREIARQFKGEFRDGERVVLAALRDSSAQRRDDIDADTSAGFKDILEANLIIPAQRRAFRELRADAGEYFDAETEETSRHDPAKQRYIAMRPALNEIEEDQRDTLNALLAGFETTTELIDWFSDVHLATHGEIPDSFQHRCWNERSTRRILLDDLTDADRYGRQIIAAGRLIPYFNLGVRDLVGRVKESPDATSEPSKEKNL